MLSLMHEFTLADGQISCSKCGAGYATSLPCTPFVPITWKGEPIGLSNLEVRVADTTPQINPTSGQAVFESHNFKKHDAAKPKWSLLPWKEVEDIVKVLTHGEQKYSKDNWKNCDDITRYQDALDRHLVAWKTGEPNDPETKASHLAHAACNLLFMMYLEKNNDKPA